ncbi:L-type lectin-domain containing protein [Gottfriedia acidiceleris]|uniref:L-type lectin-domain containing protein n=1 Tax=Gottfriedia acidiceleris TaxID=371036 RepID=UPI000B4495D9|nr:L-type lectin-domain containing protein [Gottfriedia acidiceleris]
MKKFVKKSYVISLLCLVTFSVNIPSFIWMKPIQVEAANENNPPSKINLNSIFTTPSGSNSSVIGENIVQITPNTTYQRGGIWSTVNNKMDLTKNFSSTMYMYFGNQGSNAGDGMAFVMHNDPNGTNALSPNTGSGLGVYAGQTNGASKTNGIQKSFAIEFDTFVNNSSADGYFDTNVTAGNHVAWSYPGKSETYIDYNILLDFRRTMKHNNVDGNVGVQFVPGGLSNDKWRKFTINWNASTSNLTYQLEGLAPVVVPINVQDVFGSTSVYWGFTGSTGSRYELNRVTFESVPGLVNAEVSEIITKSDGSVVEDNSLVLQGEELTYTINAKYLSGKQDWQNIILKTLLNNYVTYIPNTLEISDGSNDITLNDEIWSSKSLEVNLPNLNTTKNSVTLKFKVKVNSVTKDTLVSEESYFEGDNYIAHTGLSQYIIKKNQAPIVKINDTVPVHLLVGADYDVKGTWADEDNNTNSLYYMIDGNLLKIESVDNGGSPISQDWSYLVTSDKLKLGENTFQVYSKDEEGVISTQEELKIFVESPPTISLNEANHQVPLDFGDNFTLKGSWSDKDSEQIDLFYVIDNEAPVKFASNVQNASSKGESVEFQYTIPSEQLSLGTHEIAVYSIDDSNRQSNSMKLSLNVIGDLRFETVSNNVSFETVKISDKTTISSRNNDWIINIKDTRGPGYQWRMTATLAEEFLNDEGQLLKDALIFIDDKGVETTMKLGVPISVFEMETKSQQNISVNWETNQGLLLKINPSVHAGNYNGKIDWTLVDAP